jgi:hypothetical protein
MQCVYTAHRAPQISVIFSEPQVAQLTKKFFRGFITVFTTDCLSEPADFSPERHITCLSVSSGISSLHVSQLKLCRHLTSITNPILFVTEWGWKLQLTKLLICNFLHPPATSLYVQILSRYEALSDVSEHVRFYSEGLLTNPKSYNAPLWYRTHQRIPSFFLLSQEASSVVFAVKTV